MAFNIPCWHIERAWERKHINPKVSFFFCWLETLNGREQRELSITFHTHSTGQIKRQHQCVEVIKLHNLWHRKGSLTIAMSVDARMISADNVLMKNLYLSIRPNYKRRCGKHLCMQTFFISAALNYLSEKARNLLSN